jgi:abortive infection Abi-like protein
MSVDKGPAAFRMSGVREILDTGGVVHIEQQVRALEEAVATNPGLAFDLAKTLLESTCKAVLAERNFLYDGRWDLPKLLKETLDRLRLIPEQLPEGERVSDSLRKATGGLQTVIQGICELRNTQGFASHGRDPGFQQLESLHALLVARAADAIIHFIFQVHRGYPASAPAQPLGYEDNAAFNEYVDENNETVRIFDLEFTPSDVLFQLDPQAYQSYRTEFEVQSELEIDMSP